MANPFDIGTSEPPVVALTNNAFDAGAAIKPTISGISDDVLGGIKSVLSDFVSGAKTGVQSAIAAAPSPGSVSNFFLGGGAENALDIGANSLGSALSDAGSRAVAAYKTITNPQATGLQKGVATGEAGIGALNALFSPITSVLSTVSAVPGVGKVADMFNDIFAGIGGGTGQVAAGAVDNAANTGLISPETAATIKPLASEAAGLVAQILAGEGTNEGLGRLSDVTHSITSTISDSIKNMPPDSFQRGAIRNPFALEPGSPESKGDVGSMAVERDPAAIKEKLIDMGVRSDVAEAFASKIAESTDPSEISDLLQTAKGSQNLLDLGHMDEPNTEAPEEAAASAEAPVEQTENEASTVTEQQPSPETPAAKSIPLNIPKELQPLAAEVRKYATVDDFIKAQETKTGFRPVVGDEILKSGDYTSRINVSSGARETTAPVTDSTRAALTDFYNQVKAAGSEEPKVNTVAGKKGQTPEARAAQEEAAASAGKPTINDIPRASAADPKTSTPADFLESLPKEELASLAPEIREIAKTTGAKVHILDYLATPEFVLEKIGLGKQAADLRKAYEMYLDNRKIAIDKIQGWKDSVKDVPDNARTIFQWLDGEEQTNTPLMTDKEIEVAKEIRSYLQDWAKRLGLPEDNQIGKYITHIFEKGTIEKDFDPDLAKLIQGETPGSVYDPFLQKRVGKEGYIQDVWAALDAYVKRGTRKEAMDPALESLKNASYKLDEQSYNYVQKLAQRINMRPTEFEKLVDNLIKSSYVGYRYGDRPVAYLSNKIRSIFYRGTLGLNFGSALRNLTQGVNTYAKLGEKYTVIGYSKLAYRMMSRNVGELYENHVLDEQFIEDKKVGVYKTVLQKLDPVLFGLFETAEMINRGAAYFGAKSKAIASGKSEVDAIDYAKRVVRESQFSFGSVDTPVSLNDDAVKTLTQMQTYSIKQIEFLARMVKNKEFAGLIRWTLGSYVALNTIGKIFGMSLSQILPTVGIGGSPLGTLASNITNSFSSNAQTQASAKSGLQAQLATFIPGGAQMRKTYLGLKAYYAGKDVTATGKTRFNIPQNTLTMLQSALFGKSSLPQAQTYYDSIGKKKTTTGNPFDQ